MASTIVILFVILFVAPFFIWLWIYGWMLAQRVSQQIIFPWSQKKGLEQAVRKWESLTPEQRMDADLTRLMTDIIKPDKSPSTSAWVKSPTADEETRQMNEDAFQEGLIHRAPETQFEEVEKSELRP